MSKLEKNNTFNLRLSQFGGLNPATEQVPPWHAPVT